MKHQIEFSYLECLDLEVLYSDHNNVRQSTQIRIETISDKPRTLQIEIQGRIVFHQMGGEDIYSN